MTVLPKLTTSGHLSFILETTNRMPPKIYPNICYPNIPDVESPLVKTQGLNFFFTKIQDEIFKMLVAR